MTKIFLTTEIPSEQTAASKARVDVLNILKASGYQTVYLPLELTLKNIRKFWADLSKVTTPNSHVVIEYPCWMKKRMLFVALCCRLKGIRLYGVIHDIGSLREQISHGKDLTILKLFDGLIAHNYKMIEWLREKGYTRKVIPLDVFDYVLSTTPTFATAFLTTPVKVFYAGNLDYKKVQYVYDEKLNNLKNIKLHLYGVNFDQTRIKHSHVKYMGSFEGNAPQFSTNYHFGLIWEGNSIESCTGPIGEYIRYNNPHKFSLYLALGLPVIVWKEAAIARFVTEHNLGIVIDRLMDIDEKIPYITESEYQNYLNNVRALTQKVRAGHFLNTALEKLIA